MATEIMKKDTIKYFTKKQLIATNNAAIREKRNQQLKEDFLDNLPTDRTYPVAYHIYHTKDEVRVNILFDANGTSGFLDMSKNRYNLIPTAIMSEDGTIEYEDTEVTDSKFPYPNEREWQETVVRKPVRRQGKFRKEILKAYGNQCAVCNINNTSLLRAAHIIPAVKDNDDTVNNGICLCVLHEVAFDRGVLKITPKGEIIIANDENIKIDFTYIRLPLNKEDYPSYERLRQRFENQ